MTDAPAIDIATDPAYNPTITRQLTAESAERLAVVVKALGHPVRLQIMDILSGQVCVCDIEDHFTLSQPTISHHLKVLRKAGLIDSEKRGLWVYYYVLPEALAPLQALLDNLSAK